MPGLRKMARRVGRPASLSVIHKSPKSANAVFNCILRAIRLWKVDVGSKKVRSLRARSALQAGRGPSMVAFDSGPGHRRSKGQVRR